MASAASPISSSNANASSSSSANVLSGTGAPTEEMFLQLLVAQIQNQDPLNPTDSTQFVSQLAQFSELEQVMAIRGDTDTLVTDASQSAAGSTTNTDNSTQTTTPSGTTQS